MAPSLAERLRGIVTGRDTASRGVPRLAPDVLAEAKASANLSAVADVLGGEWIDRAEGRVLVVDRFYPQDHRYGREPLGHVVERLVAGADGLSTLARAWRTAPNGHAGHPFVGGRDGCPQLLFLDLETTGLAGGAGTQAFLVGCAFIEDEGMRVRQFLLPGFEHERALLAELAAWTRDQGGLVTFNGRSFDLPLIETRYLFHRLQFPLADVPHLDMLHPARRLWAPQRGRRAGDPANRARPAIAGPALDPFDTLRVHEESCRLSVLERHLGGVHRVGDVPGCEIPSRYFQFVRDGDARPLEAVLEHNRLDLLSLALVTARAMRLIERGPGQTAHAGEALGLGRIYERAGARADAEACYLHAAELARRIGREPLVRADALRRLALCRRRDGRAHDAALAWEELLDTPGAHGSHRLEAREALAIHYEHRSKDLRTARMLVLDVLADDHTESRHRAASYRLQRLERKLAVREEGGLLAALDAALAEAEASALRT